MPFDSFGRLVSSEYIETIQRQQAAWDQMTRTDQQYCPRGTDYAMNWRGYANNLDQLATFYDRAGNSESAKSTRLHAQDLRDQLNYQLPRNEVY